MTGVAAMAGSTLASLAQGQEISSIELSRERRKTFVLVHGSWYNSGTWERVAHQLVAAGHAVVMRDRLAFGLNAKFPQSYVERPLDVAAFSTEASPVADITLAQDVKALNQQIFEAVEGSPNQVILVGHSSGGIVITGAAEQHPELISNVVYLAAFMPAPGVTGLADLQSNDNNNLKAIGSLFLGDPTQTGALRVDWRTQDPAYFAGLQNGFYADGDVTSFRAAINAFAPDDPVSIYAEPTAKTAERWGSVKRSYIRTGNDVAILPPLQDRWIAQADALTPSNPTSVYRIASSHTALLSHPKRVASILLEIANRS